MSITHLGSVAETRALDARLSMNESNSATDSQRRRQVELLCTIARGLTELGDKLDDLSVLNQQQTDLLRRLIKGVSGRYDSKSHPGQAECGGGQQSA